MLGGLEKTWKRQLKNRIRRIIIDDLNCRTVTCQEERNGNANARKDFYGTGAYIDREATLAL